MMLRRRDIEVRDLDNFDDLAIAMVELTNIKEGYEKLGLDVPDWLNAKLTEGKHELDARVRVRKEKRLLQLRQKREGLLTADEKRAKVDAEIADLEKQLI